MVFVGKKCRQRVARLACGLVSFRSHSGLYRTPPWRRPSPEPIARLGVSQAVSAHCASNKLEHAQSEMASDNTEIVTTREGRYVSRLRTRLFYVIYMRLLPPKALV